MIPRGPNTRSGILLIDKPAGLTSAKAVDHVKRALKIRKAGHAGTLDPFATGLLICCLNRATRLARFFLHGDKTYQATLLLGMETDTGDFSGNPVFDFSGPAVSENQIRSVLKQFVGKIRQAPPVYSALKHQGIPLHRLARQGKKIQKPPRTVFIRSLTLLEVDYPNVRFEVTCSAGTYVRSLGIDVGRTLGCGGHLLQLRRIQSGGFHVDEAIPLSRFEDPSEIDAIEEEVLPMAEALKNFPELEVGNAIAEKLRCGKPITAEDLKPIGTTGKDPETCIKVIDERGALLAVLSRNENGSYGYCGVFQQ